MQLVKILKRKLQMSDPDFGPRQAKYIDKILQREPIKKFILYARRCYYSDEVFN